MPIHPTAIIDKHAEIDPSVEVGPYAIIEAGVKIGPRCKIWPHAFIARGTTLANDVRVHPFAVVGHHPQDLAWKETPSYTQIGEGTIIREHATVHRGTPPETTTVVGKRCFIMASAHVGHNCTVGDDVKLVNGAMLGGWVQVGDKAFISGNVGAQQFTRIGELCMIGGVTRVITDVAPFMTAVPWGVVGLNLVGLRRAGINPDERTALRRAYRTIFRSGLLLPAALAQLDSGDVCAPVRRLIDFMRIPAKRGFMRYYGGRTAAADAD